MKTRENHGRMPQRQQDFNKNAFALLSSSEISAKMSC